jgi:serine/threonine-protein phosphatase 2A regulatory subunit B'
MLDSNKMTNLIIPNIKPIMEMIEKNIFRPLPILKKTINPDTEDQFD